MLAWQEACMKVVALFSGGLDSTVLLWDLLTSYNYDDIHLIGVNYGQRNSQENRAAQDIIFQARRDYGDKITIRYDQITIDGLANVLSGNALTGTVETPQAHYTDIATKSVIVPARNMMFLTLAWAAAVNDDAYCVTAALYSEGDGMTLFPDTTPYFVRMAEHALHAATGDSSATRYLALPFMYLSKPAVVMLGNDIGAPMELSWSCYSDGPVHCGLCPACRKRREAFEKVDIEDLTVYYSKEVTDVSR
jgi:7-cyano-7-deazaguanine synthase